MGLTKVTSGAITDSAITSAKIEDGTIVNADISSSAAISQSKLTLTIPTVSSITIQDSQGAIPPTDTSLYFDVVGTNFTNPSTVELLDSSTNASTNATTVTYVSATQLRVTASLSAGTYKIRVIRSDGFAGNSATALLTVSQAVSWSTSAGSLGSFDEGVAISTITLSATSNSAVTYAIQSGSLPSGLSLNTSNGQITGTPGSVSADTTSTFTVRATDAESQYADREFTITVSDIVIFQSLRFNDDDNAYLSRTMATGTSRRIFTFSTWVKRSALGSFQYVFTNSPQSSFDAVRFNSDDSLDVRFNNNTYTVNTNRLYRDVASWYHIVVSVDTTQATASDRVKIYTNGTLETSLQGNTYPTQDYDTSFGVSGQTYQVSANTWGPDQPFDGYMAEVHFIDGQALTPSSFGSTDSTTGHWKPKAYSGSYGTNGFYLDFADSSAFGDDESGNTNDFTPANLTANDKTTDTPHNNFSSILPMANTSLSDGNLKLTTSRTGYWDGTVGTIGAKSGKWYWEIVPTFSSGNFRCVMGVIGNQASQTVVLNGKGGTADPSGTLFDNYTKTTWTTSYYKDGSTNGTTTAPNSGDIINVAVDLDNNKIYFGINNTYYANDGGTDGDPSNNLNESMSGLDSTVSEYMPFFQIRSDSSIGDNIMIANFGQDSSFSGTKTAQNNSDENGYGDFYYTPPSGFKALCTNNLPEATVKDPSAYFNTVLYTGTGSTGRSVTGVGFQPDIVWIKNRTDAWGHSFNDSSRGPNKTLITNSSTTEQASYAYGYLSSFDSDGFTLADGATGDDFVNQTSDNYVAWNWNVNDATTSSNTDGSITSTVQANTTSGVSIVTYTGTGSLGTIGHGLGAAPKCLIIKSRTSSDNWKFWSQELATNSHLNFNQDAITITSIDILNSTAPSSSVFTLSGGHTTTNYNGTSYVAYCFAEVEGFSKFGSYTGNGSTTDSTRPFIYTGFKPAFVIIKATGTVTDWRMIDSARNTYNPANARLFPNQSTAEITADEADFLSNGFKLRGTQTTGVNQSGYTYIYMAFAESPFGGILTTETTAR